MGIIIDYFVDCFYFSFFFMYFCNYRIVGEDIGVIYLFVEDF